MIGMQIGPYSLAGKAVLAPMAGITDLPFRRLCRRFGAALATTEMMSANTRLWNTRKSLLRLDHSDEAAPISVQILGTDPDEMALAAQYNVSRGAQIIDINMGCPAKKVCNKAAGSALMKDERLVERILTSVTSAVSVPVTLKIRTGWDREHRNAVTVAQIAQDAGIAALSIHGRTRACRFTGQAEYDTIASVKSRVAIPVIANGDITCAQKAAEVLANTGADGVMIGRAAQGRPWIFHQINQYLEYGLLPDEPDLASLQAVMTGHVKEIHSFYGPAQGARIARKHIGWYCKNQSNGVWLRREVNQTEDANKQLALIEQFFEAKCKEGELAA